MTTNIDDDQFVRDIMQKHDKPIKLVDINTLQKDLECLCLHWYGKSSVDVQIISRANGMFCVALVLCE